VSRAGKKRAKVRVGADSKEESILGTPIEWAFSGLFDMFFLSLCLSDFFDRLLLQSSSGRSVIQTNDRLRALRGILSVN